MRKKTEKDKKGYLLNYELRNFETISIFNE